MKLAVSITIALLLTTTGFSATIHVPGDYPTIQGAIDAAVSGDTILVDSGTYIENLHFSGKTLTLISVNGPGATVIDGNRTDSVVNIMDSPDGSVVEGFTITNGLGELGGGIRANTQVYIHDCTVVSNETEGFIPNGHGGGIYCASAVITDCIISSNRTSYYEFPWSGGYAGHGGGIYISSGQCIIRDCTISNNETGSGVGFYGGFEGGSGAGVYAQPAASLEMVDCEILDNKAGTGAFDMDMYGHGGPGGSGGGIYCIDGDIRSCLISGNEAGQGGHADMGLGGDGGDGGGLYVRSGSTILQNCLIVNNKAGDSPVSFGYGFGKPGNGGGIAFGSNGLSSVINCTITGNEAGKAETKYGLGGSIYGENGSGVVVTNSISWQNVPDELYILFSGNVTYSNVFNGYTGGGNIDEDPQFENPSLDDYHLKWTSPCINRGMSDGAPATDLDGNPRLFMSAVDMGAYEFTGHHPLETDTFILSVSQGAEIYLNIDARPKNSGRPYILLGSIAGTAPGFPLPGGMELRLDWDGFTDLVVDYLNNTYFLNFMSTVDASGRGTATLWVPGLNPVWIGHTMYYAATLYSPFDFVTNPIEIQVVE